MLFIRQGAPHKVPIGPAVAVGDGFTPVTNLALSTADEAEVILHDNGTVVDISAYTWAAITTADGYYHLTLQSGISGTVGQMRVVINDDSLVLPIKEDFTVVEEEVYDALYAAGAVGWLKPSVAGRDLVIESDGVAHADVKEWLGVAPDALVGGKLATIGLISSDTAQAAAATTITLAAGEVAHVGDMVTIFSATTASKESRFITAWDNGTKVATVDAWDATPTGTIVYFLFHVAPAASTGVTVGSINVDAVDSVAFAANAATELQAAIWAAVVEGTTTFQQLLTLLAAAAAGKLSGGATATNVLRDLADTLDRITATVDSSGNRTAITTDFTDL
jgi:hypothetical protein